MEQPGTLRWDFPLPRPHCGVALGNGNLGVLVWGDERLCLTINRADWWDHRGGEKLLEGNTYQSMIDHYDPLDSGGLERALRREPRPDGALRSSRLPCGRLELKLDAGARPVRAVLDYRTGWLTVDLADGGLLRVIVAVDQDVLFVDDPGQKVVGVRPRPAWEWVGDELAKYRFEPPKLVESIAEVGWAQACPEDPALAVLGQQAHGGLVVATATAVTADAAIAAARQLGVAFRPLALTTTESWWADYWRDMPTVDLPDAFLSRFFTSALWRFGAATTPLASLPAGLQGPWVEEYQLTPWSGDYHFNVNIQQIYTLGYPLGRFAHFLPLFDMLDRCLPVFRRHAQVLLGIDDGLAMIHAIDDRGQACGGISAGSVIDHAVAAWTACLYWWYYRYTGDVDFLRQRAWPFMHGVMRVYEAMLQETADGWLLPLGISAEYAQPFADGRRQNVGANPSYQLACIHRLTTDLLEAAAVLGEAPSPLWARLQAELPPYTVVERDGEQRIAIWSGQDLDICHRHHSHLGCVYPFDTLDWTDPAQMAVLDSSLDHWIWRGMGQWSEWCYPWAVILQARLGLTESPLLLLDIWRRVFLNEWLATAYLPQFRGLTAHRKADMAKPRETNEIMQLDGTMAGATAILELLVHSRGGTVYVFPAVSETWPDVSFSGVWLPGGHRISAERRGGETRLVRLTSARGGALRLAVPGWSKAVARRTMGRQRLDLPADIVLVAGETVVLERVA